MPNDWVDWHGAYDDAESGLSRRLAVVRRRIGEVLDAAGTGPVRVLGLCSGDGRDLLPELIARPQLRAGTVLVELDPTLVDRARATAAATTGVEVRHADAGDPRLFADVAPVDLLLLCGIFGNVSDADIRTTVAAAPSLLLPSGTVIWTRGRFGDQDLRPAIRGWFQEVDLTIQMAEALVESLAGAFEPDRFHDDYREQVLDLIRKKADGEEFETPEPATEKPKIVDLMAALEASVEAAKTSRTRHPTSTRSAAKKSTAKKVAAKKSA